MKIYFLKRKLVEILLPKKEIHWKNIFQIMKSITMFFLNRKCLHKDSFKIISNPETTKISCNCLPSLYLRVNPEYRHFWYTRTDGQLFINRYSSQIFFWGCFPENICRPVPLVRTCTVCTTIYLSYIYITPSDFIVQLSLVKWSWPIDNWAHRWGGHIIKHPPKTQAQ